MDSLIHISVGVLLPLVPAYILFKTLPTDATVEGPWKGLKIKLGGGFGGYFLLVLLVLSYLYWMNEQRNKQTEEVRRLTEELRLYKEIENRAYKVFAVRGKVGAEDKSYFDTVEDFQIYRLPKIGGVSPNGKFEAYIPVRLKPDATLDPTEIIIDYPSYSAASVNLDDNNLVTQKLADREITLKTPVIMLKKHEEGYSPATAQQPKAREAHQ